MPDAVEQFAEHARGFRVWVLCGSDAGPAAARRALELVSGLYTAALALPHERYEPESAAREPEPPPEWKVVYPILAARLPFQHYGVVFNPLPVPPEQSIVGDLADDLADVFGDVDNGLRWFEVGQRAEALWEWQFQFVHHWGDHATTAIRALHSWLVTEHPDIMTEHSPAD